MERSPLSYRHLLIGFLVMAAMLIAGSGFLQGVRTSNHPPVAKAGPDQTVPTGSTVTLNGGGSTDEDGDSLTFTWRLISRPEGSLAALENAKDVRPTFKVDLPGNYVIRLVVNDGYTDGAPDT